MAVMGVAPVCDFAQSVPRLTSAGNHGYANRTVPHWTGGFGSPCKQGAEDLRRKVQVFFYVSRFMAGGVLGGFGLPSPCLGLPTRTSSAAQSLVASSGGLKPFARSSAMNAHTPVAPSALQISNISVRQDSAGRYCLNDLHKAAGGQSKHQPANYLRLGTTKELCAEIDTSSDMRSIEVISGRNRNQGTYVVKELVYAYAMWISASFSLKVIRAYDALQSQPSNNSGQLPKSTALESVRSRVLVSIEGDQVYQSVVPLHYCLVDPTNADSLCTLINEYVPIELLAIVSDTANKRLLSGYQASLLRGKA